MTGLMAHQKPMPEDFARIAPLHTKTAIRRMYKVGVTTVARWLDEAGVSAKLPGHKTGVRNKLWAHDSSDKIAMCLSCEAVTCCGDCEQLHLQEGRG